MTERRSCRRHWCCWIEFHAFFFMTPQGRYGSNAVCWCNILQTSLFFSFRQNLFISLRSRGVVRCCSVADDHTGRFHVWRQTQEQQGGAVITGSNFPLIMEAGGSGAVGRERDREREPPPGCELTAVLSEFARQFHLSLCLDTGNK